MTNANRFKGLIARFIGMPLLKVIWRSCRIRVEGFAHFDRVSNERVLICLWHEHLLLMPHFISNIAPGHPYCAVISHSRDGQLIRQAARGMDNISFLTIPHDRKAHIFRSINGAVDKGLIILITPDGPRGPPREIKPSLTALARLAKAKVLPLSWTASKVWRLPTWDKMALPRPFSRVTVRIGALVEVGNSTSQDVLKVQNGMSLSEQIDICLTGYDDAVHLPHIYGNGRLNALVTLAEIAFKILPEQTHAAKSTAHDWYERLKRVSQKGALST